MASGRLRLHLDPVPGIGLWDAIPELLVAQPVAAALPVDRQPPQETLRSKRPITSKAAPYAAVLNKLVGLHS